MVDCDSSTSTNSDCDYIDDDREVPKHPGMPAQTQIVSVVENGLPMLTAGIKMGIAAVKIGYNNR